ncbi:Phage integrase family protein [Gemmata obscuriglobus]|uniref:Tyr recombinase domain-containing protein n=1 Tax=Gemmata obscuriglobus TaxID=114 RepID=A0A2Z3H4N4_9BACT|nr:tyrosine-type recombinase/integrase [Gemmata obscuriglobus]AWM41739.1 hypothetical protein C1280_35245 [Gemmata obscuriglobus]QEG32312.1 Phage integrase family protein [Gemmata obscuriglobus]VTS11668.1 catalytic phage domain protein : Integrase, catalytic core, phage domain protein OS=Rhodopirellula sallentina SM41 GN=RSSM_06627 PE=4 SV=1: Phage_integrase [Gemmata obscuriglobus UQM 2246]
MARPRNPVPKYLLHKPSGQARVRVAGRDVYLGPYGSAESKKEYERVLAELAAQAPAVAAAPTTKSPRSLTVAEMVLAFWGHAKEHYRDRDGNPTSEIRWLKESLAEVLELYGHKPAVEFGPLALKAVRKKWMSPELDLCRGTINARANRVRRVFKWAASEELVPITTYTALTTVAGLELGRTKVRESEPVGPVLDLHVGAALPFLNPTVRAMALVQRLSGCRPQDVQRMRAGQVDRTALPWVYRPPRHKTDYKGATRTILFGPEAAEILGPILDKLQPDDVVFSPVRAKAERYAALRAKRKTKVQPSQESRKKKPAELKHKTPEIYTRHTYGKSVRAACIKAGVPHWHPNQLRHTYGTEIRRIFGLEAAQVLLGHSKADVTQVYAERNLELASAIARKIG